MKPLSEVDQLKNQLREQETIYKNILEGTLAGYWDWKIPENYEYLSPTFKSMFGYEDHEMPNHPDSWQKIIFQEDLPKVFESFGAHVQSKGEIPFHAETRYTHKNGSTIWVYCRGKVIEWDEKGNPLRAVGSHVDITKLKEVEEAAKKDSMQLALKNKELEQFAYVASHDLQEPIRTISSFTSLLAQQYKGQLGEEADQYLNFILDSTSRMKSMVNGLLEHSRIGHEKKLVIVDGNALIKQIQEDMKVSITEAGAKIIVGELPAVAGHETQIRLLFQNLISNALKFRKQGTPVKIQIIAEQRTDEVQFSVIDNGIGIEEKYKEHIFAMFQRLHAKTEYEGTGIGLAHCQKIVALHGGSIWVESKLNEGSTFHFTIKQ